jgi:hypothetical protein
MMLAMADDKRQGRGLRREFLIDSLARKINASIGCGTLRVSRAR